MRRKQGPVIVSQCQRDLDEGRKATKEMYIRMEQLWLDNRKREKKNE